MRPINKSLNKGRIAGEIVGCKQLIDKANRTIVRNNKRIPNLEQQLLVLNNSPHKLVLLILQHYKGCNRMTVFHCPWPRDLTDDEVIDAVPWRYAKSPDVLEEVHISSSTDVDEEVRRLTGKYNIDKIVNVSRRPYGY